MAESLFSESWYRVENLKPRLRSHAEIHRHRYRGKDWYVLQDHSSGRFHRFSPEAYHIIGLMDGRRPLNEIWESACESLGDDMPTQDEVIRLLSQLHQADVLQTDMLPDIGDLHQRHRKERRGKILGQIRSPFAVRFPLLDPDRFLTATRFLFRPFFGWAAFFIWCAVIISALVLVAVHWSEMTTNLADRVLAMENLFLLWLVYPAVKVLHEFGHAYAVKHWGGEVHEMGIMLLVFIPIPYLDASSSSAFYEKRKRVLVGAAGIMIECFLAALAVWVWVNVEPGVVRSIAFNVAIIAGVSTILFNGNPLLRFDAYYILSDLLEIPNLGSRANRYIGYLAQRYLLGIKEAQSPVTAAGEARWFFFYAIAAFGYRIFIMIRIGLFVASKLFFIGLVLVAWGMFSVFVTPLFRVLKHAFTDPGLQRKRSRILAVTGAGIVMAAAAILAVPAPSFTVAQGILWAPENSQVHAAADGFIRRLAAASGQAVRAGDPLAICASPELDAEVKILESELREYRLRHRQSTTRNRIEADILQEEVARIEAELARKSADREALVIRSPADGVFLVAGERDLPGRFLRRGAALGHVVDFSKMTARVVVPQRSVDRILGGTRAVSARLPDRLDRDMPAAVLRAVPAATADLPSLALSLEGGGALALDPRAADTPKAFEKLFHFEVKIFGFKPKTVGQRVFIRFEHAPEPVAFRWYRSIRRTLLSKFSV